MVTEPRKGEVMSEEGKISFFTEVDMTQKDGGKIISSEYPTWYSETMLEDMKEDMQRDEMILRLKSVPEQQYPAIRARIERTKKKLAQIEQGIPELSEQDKNRVQKVRKELSKEISSMMFTRSQMLKGLADGHQEAKRMSEFRIPVNQDIADVARGCNVPIVDGKISRSGAEKIWKIASKYFGEMSNVEALRRD
jgi:hypothetical protein